jgi:DNA-directed RNA polymerase subunit M
LLIPTTKDGKKLMKCSRCSYTDKDVKHSKISEKVKTAKEIVVVDQEVETNPKTKHLCTKCKCKEAYWWEVQTRAGDEPPTRFFKCVKCGFVNREY